MAIRIILEQEHEGYSIGKELLITSTKLKQMQKDKIKFRTRLVSGTGTRKYEFEKPEKTPKTES